MFVIPVTDVHSIVCVSTLPTPSCQRFTPAAFFRLHLNMSCPQPSLPAPPFHAGSMGAKYSYKQASYFLKALKERTLEIKGFIQP